MMIYKRSMGFYVKEKIFQITNVFISVCSSCRLYISFKGSWASFRINNVSSQSFVKAILLKKATSSEAAFLANITYNYQDETPPILSMLIVSRFNN